MNESDIPWRTYKSKKSAALEALGYAIRHGKPDENWLTVGVFRSPRAESYLSAVVQFFQEPSHFGINDGRISRLTIRDHYRPTCQDLFLKREPMFTEWYNFDRGLDFDNLDNHREAKRLYTHLIDVLN